MRIKVKWHKAAEQHKHEGPFWECCSLPWGPGSYSYIIFPYLSSSDGSRQTLGFHASSSIVTPCKNSNEESADLPWTKRPSKKTWWISFQARDGESAMKIVAVQPDKKTKPSPGVFRIRLDGMSLVNLHTKILQKNDQTMWNPWRTPGLKWKLKLVSYQSWTERPTSSPPTQWPAPALSQCLSAGTRRGGPNKWSCEGYDRSLSSPLATFCFEAKIVNWPSSLWNQLQPLLWKTVLITSGYGSNLPSTRLSIQWINMYRKFRDHWTMANCSLSKLQICVFTVTTLLEAERLLESHLKLASANGPRSIENLWRKATESVLLQDCKIWTQQITKEASQSIFQRRWLLVIPTWINIQSTMLQYTHLYAAGTCIKGQGVPRSHQISRHSLQAPHLKMLQLFFQLIGWDLKFRNLGTAGNI